MKKKTDKSSPRNNTLSIHDSGEYDNPNTPLINPIHMTTSFKFETLQEFFDNFNNEENGYTYTRFDNPSIRQLEARIAALEKGADGVAFSSGMAAISTVLLSLLGCKNELIVHQNLYGSTFALIKELLPQYGIKINIVDLSDLDTLKQAISKNTKVIFFETPTNPSLDIIDIKRVCALAKKCGVLVIVDSSFSTPIIQRPLGLGADIVIHSATKYLAGHADTMGGFAISNNKNYLKLLKTKYLAKLGGILSPFNAWLILRGIKTLALRMKQIEKNTLAVAQYLQSHPKIDKITYPGFPSHPQHHIAKKQMSGFGGTICCEICGNKKNAINFVESLKLIKLATCMGGTETLACIPALMTHQNYSQADFKKANFSEKTIRLAIGLEDHEDIILDIDTALGKL